MNSIKGIITDVKVEGSLSLVSIDTKAGKLSSIIIDTPENLHYLKPGHEINAIFKETEVVLATGINLSISLQNRLEGVVSTLKRGKLLSKVVIDSPAGPITSIITSNAVSQLRIEVGSKVTAMIKTNEIMLSE